MWERAFKRIEEIERYRGVADVDFHDRYAYCRYNPFKWTDPSGEARVGTSQNIRILGEK